MALQKQSIDISFAQGLDTKSDPKRVPAGKFVRLENSVFNKEGLLQKRDGYPKLPSLPNSPYSYVTTFNDNLTSVGDNIAAFDTGGNKWVVKGNIQPVTLETLPVIRNNLNQSAQDVAIAPNGTACAVYLETNGGSTTNKYVVFNSVTGQNITAPAAIPVASGTVSGGMRVFVLGNNFIIIFTNTITATDHLQYVSVNINTPTLVGANTDIASAYISATTLSWDAYVVNDQLFIAYNNTTGGQNVKVTYMTQGFIIATPVTFAGEKATMMSVTADMATPSNPTIYVSYYDAAASDGFTLAVDQNLNTIFAPTSIIASGTYLNITSAAYDGVCSIFGEVSNAYSYDGTIPSNYINKNTVDVSGTASGMAVSILSLGLASKAFVVDEKIYYLGAYQSPYQPTYFLINGTDDSSGAPVVAKLAYQDGGGYLTLGLPGVNIEGSTARIGYRFKNLIQAVNKNTDVPSGTQINGIYSQTGVNLASFTFGTENLTSSEIASDLHLTGGFLWMYDGYLPVEHNFFLYPDSIKVTTNGAGGLITAQKYFYQVTYEWSDNQGNIFRSAPSIPVEITTTGSTSTNTINVPYLRITAKVANPVKIVVYRWSTAQQSYYQVTSITAPILNNVALDSVAITDTLADSTILGNNLLYTTGGVVENVNAPACNAIANFDSRLWAIDAEDPDTLWFSKQIVETVPVEMSDLLTLFVPSNVSTQGSTGPMKTIYPMDDKLIIGKKNALLYINGNGPDNTGSNNQYSQPIFITSTVGCENQKSIVLIPQGLMFQSDKGIWLLGRDLSTKYIGAPVEEFTQGALVNSAVSVPGTNQVRFTLDTGRTLVYDYFYDQWDTSNISAISSCIYGGFHTFINSSGEVYQQMPGTYKDGSSPVLMAFKTGWIRLDQLQGYQRAYFFYLLGTYYSPHKLYIKIYKDYSDSPFQTLVISPTNYSPPMGDGGSQSPYGQQEVYGGPSNLEDWQIFLDDQRCMAFAIEVEEVFDPTYGTDAGEGLNLSGISAILGFKKGYRPQAAKHQAG